MTSRYLVTIGLEIHLTLRTTRKAFCGCAASHTAEPNTLVCPVCKGEGGSAPQLNMDAFFMAAAAGIVLGCRINRESWFDRKFYDAPDLPKGYQITQHEKPVAVNGGVTLHYETLSVTVPIRQVHMEEDAGKTYGTGNPPPIDYNRAGMPLAEIVTEPIEATGEIISDCVKKISRDHADLPSFGRSDERGVFKMRC